MLRSLFDSLCVAFTIVVALLLAFALTFKEAIKSMTILALALLVVVLAWLFGFGVGRYMAVEAVEKALIDTGKAEYQTEGEKASRRLIWTSDGTPVRLGRDYEVSIDEQEGTQR